MKYPLWSSLAICCGGLVFVSPLPAAAPVGLPVEFVRPAPGETTARIHVTGSPDLPYRLLSSTDLRSWLPLPAQTADSEGRASFPVSLNSTQRFFRAVTVTPVTTSTDPATVLLGKRLFDETRFAQFFAANGASALNAPLSNGGDPVLSEAPTLSGVVPGPLWGQSMSCRACHLEAELASTSLGGRTLADYGARSRIPERGDGNRTTLRNSPALVNAALERPVPFFLHFDGEFPDGVSLVKGTLTGRNFGWLPTERAQAIRHIARVIREDDGRAFQGPELGGAYGRLLAGVDPDLPPAWRLPVAWRLEVDQASDLEILDRVAGLVDQYLQSVRFATDGDGRYQASPYDTFLRKNALPQQPDPGESDLAYSRRLRDLLARLTQPAFVTSADGYFARLTQPFRFGPEELQGLRVFLAEPPGNPPAGLAAIGNCLVCHPAPHFTDFDFHNSGATQWEYDTIHGEGAFASISIPSLAERAAAPQDYLPPSAHHPDATGRFGSVPTRARPGFVDLGVWNVYGNLEMPGAQAGLHALLSSRFGTPEPEALLARSVALFKTPGLRGLSLSAPYLHTGQASTLESAMFFYRFTAELGRAQALRNPDPEISRIFLSRFDGAPLSAFLRSLNEDFPGTVP